MNQKKITKILKTLNNQHQKIFSSDETASKLEEASEIISELSRENLALSEKLEEYKLNTSQGTWVEKKSKYYDADGIRWHICSVCGNKPLRDRLSGEEVLSLYCPFCGDKKALEEGQ